MRQLVSIVADGKVRYFVHDGDDVHQVAEITDPGGADIATVIEIGVSLGALYERRNGTGAKQPARRAKASTPATPVPAKKRSGAPGSGRRVDVDIEEIIAAVHRQPGRTGAELGAELLPNFERIPANAAIGYRVEMYLDQCQRDGVAPAIRVERGQSPTSPRHYFPA